jgi:hypothetical protein
LVFQYFAHPFQIWLGNAAFGFKQYLNLAGKKILATKFIATILFCGS